MRSSAWSERLSDTQEALGGSRWFKSSRTHQTLESDMNSQDAEAFCKQVDEKLTWWLDEGMKGYTERQYGKQQIRELRDANPLRVLGADAAKEADVSDKTGA